MSKKIPKKKKRYSAATPEEYNAAKAEVKGALKQFNWRLAGEMLAIFAVLCIVYYLLLQNRVYWASPVLYTAAAVLFLVFFFVNRGFSRDVVPRESLPDDWTEERKTQYIEEDRTRKEFARKIMVVMVPVLLVVAVDMLSLFVLPLFVV